MADFEPAFLRTMSFEDDPAHPGRVTPEPHGGRARLGVNSVAHPEVPDYFWTAPYPVALEFAERLFRLHYWDGLRLDGVGSQDVANKVYDMAVNMGGRTAVKMLQGVLGVKVDGVVGPFTLAAANSTEPAGLVERLRAACTHHYLDLIGLNPEEYGPWREGWLRRAGA